MWQLSTQRQASHSQEVLGRPVSGGVGGEGGTLLQSHHRPAQAQGQAICAVAVGKAPFARGRNPCTLRTCALYR